MELYVSSEALAWLLENGFDPSLIIDDMYVDSYVLGDWLEDNNYSYSGDFVDGFTVFVNASERYNFFPNELGE